MEISEQVQGILATLPTKPGCYLMKNAEGKIIYVGKAINLKNRVRSYFHADSSHDNKTRRLVRDIADIEWIVVGSELEALILEMNLIKKHRPKYNVRLKDDKRYPYIKVHWNDRGRGALFWSVHFRMGGIPDLGCAAQSLPLSDMRSRDHRPGQAGVSLL